MEAAPDILLTGLQRRERWAYEAAIDEYGPAVYAIASSYRLNPTDREEVFQATFLTLMENLARIRAAESLPGWLAKVASSHCLKAKGRFDIPFDLTVANDDEDEWPTALPPHPVDEGEPEPPIYDRAESEALSIAIGDLSERDFQLMVLLFGERVYTYSDIASILDVSAGSIGPLRTRMLNRLRSHPAIQARLAPSALRRTA